MLKETLEIFEKIPREDLINLVNITDMNVILYAIDENNQISKYGKPFKISIPKQEDGNKHTAVEIDNIVRNQIPINLQLLKSMLYDSQWVILKKCLSDKLSNISYLSYLVNPETKVEFLKEIYRGKTKKLAYKKNNKDIKIEITKQSLIDSMPANIKAIQDENKNKPNGNGDLLNFLLGELHRIFLMHALEKVDERLNVDMELFEERMGTPPEIPPFNQEEFNNIVKFFKTGNNASEIYLKDTVKEQTRVFFVYTKNGEIDVEKTIRRYKEESDRYSLLVGIFNGGVMSGTCTNKEKTIEEKKFIVEIRNNGEKASSKNKQEKNEEEKLYYNPAFNSLPDKKALVGTMSRPTEAPEMQTIEELMLKYEFGKFLQIKSRYNTYYFDEKEGITVLDNQNTENSETLNVKQMYYKISRDYKEKNITEMECMIPEINNEIKTIEVKDYVTGGRRLTSVKNYNDKVKTHNDKVKEQKDKEKTPKEKELQPITIYENVDGTEEVIINKIRKCFGSIEGKTPLNIFSDDKQIAKKNLLVNYQESMLSLYQTDNTFGAIDRTNMYLSVLNFIEEGVEENFMNMKENLKLKLETKEDFELENAEQFGFLVGQLLKLALNRSKSGDKHLGYVREIMKTRKVGRMKNQLIDKVFTNAQDFKYNYVKEQKALGAVLTYPNEDEILNEVFILTGFLADSILIPVKKQAEETDTTQEYLNKNQRQIDLDKVS